MPIAPLFQRFVDDELALAPALVARVVAGTIQLLGPAKDGAGGAERMPPLATELVDSSGIELVRQWIAGLAPP